MKRLFVYKYYKTKWWKPIQKEFIGELQLKNNNIRKNDYKIILETIKETEQSGVTSSQNARKVLERFIELLIPKLQKDNPNFDKDKFNL